MISESSLNLILVLVFISYSLTSFLQSTCGVNFKREYGLPVLVEWFEYLKVYLVPEIRE